VFRGAMDCKEFSQAMQHIVGLQLARRDDGETLARKLVDNSQHAEYTSVLRSVLDEIVSPDMARTLGPQTDAGTIVQPETTAFRLLLRHFQPFLSPDAIDHCPAGKRSAAERGASDSPASLQREAVP